MVFFLLAAICSAVFFAWIVVTDPSPAPIMRLPKKLAGAVPYISPFLFGALLILFLWLASAGVHPRNSVTAHVADVILSPQFSKSVLGFFFGAFFVIWVRRIYDVVNKKKLPFYLVMEGLFLLGLFLAGSSDIFSSLLARLDTLKLPGAELSFFQAAASDKQVRSGATAGGTSPGSADSGLALQGLSFLINLSSWMESDYKTYLPSIRAADPLASPRAHDPAEPIVPATMPFVKRYVAPLAKCHGAIVGKTADQHMLIETFSNVFLPLSEIVAVANAAETASADGSGHPNPDTMKRLDGPIRELSTTLAQGIVRTRSHAKVMWTEFPKDCQDLLDLDVPQEDQKMFAESLKRELSRVLESDARFIGRPYFALAYAAVASLLNQPGAGIEELDTWASARESKFNQAPGNDVEGAWLIARVRLSIFILLEEWLRHDPNLPSSVREYHFLNLQRAIDAYARIRFVVEGFAGFGNVSDLSENAYMELPHHEPCSIKDRNQYNVSYTYLTLLINYVEKAVEQPNYDIEYSPTAVNYMTIFNKLSLGCIFWFTKSADTEEVARANMLKVSARVILANLRASLKIKTADQTRQALELALSAAKLGSEAVHEQTLQMKSFSQSIEGSPKREVAVELKNLRSQIQKDLDGL